MRVLAVCGMGFGTSLILMMSIQEISEKYNIKIHGESVDLDTYKEVKTDVIIASVEIAKRIDRNEIPVIEINDILNIKEIEDKVISVYKKLHIIDK